MGMHRIGAIIFAAALGMTGCGSPPSIDGAIVADSAVNPDPSDRAVLSPRPIHKHGGGMPLNADQVASAGFFPLFEQPGQVLGAALLKAHEYTFGPGESRTIQFDFNDATRYIVVVAAYRDIDRSQWWAVQPIRPGRRAELEIRLERTSVVISPR